MHTGLADPLGSVFWRLRSLAASIWNDPVEDRLDPHARDVWIQFLVMILAREQGDPILISVRRDRGILRPDETDMADYINMTVAEPTDDNFITPTQFTQPKEGSRRAAS